MFRTLLNILIASILASYPGYCLSSEQLVIQHGAAPDDEKLDTRAIQAAIDTAANAGGGIVRFPSGTFLTGGLMLRNNITLRLDEGAILKGSTDHRDYGEGRWSQALIRGDGLTGIRIHGPGTIDGADCKNPKGEEGFRGPHGILLIRLRRHHDFQCDDQARTGISPILCRRCRNAQADEGDRPWRA